MALSHRCCKSALALIRGANNAVATSSFSLRPQVPQLCVIKNSTSSSRPSSSSSEKNYCTTSTTSLSQSRFPSVFNTNLNGFNMNINQFRRQAHTKSAGDQQFIEFLNTEIETETRDLNKDVVSIPGFSVDIQGPKVKLTKQHANETCTVELNITGSVDVIDDDDEIMEGDVDTGPPEMVARPDFDITLQKEGSSSKLCLKCSFVDPSLNKDKPEDEIDNFEIVEVAMVEGEWSEDTYYVNADILDPTMYDMLMLMLEERGINHSTFCEQLMELTTDTEHKTYLNMLHSLQDYLKK